MLGAGRCISIDSQVNGSIRIMVFCLNTGEAAGMTAAMARQSDCDVHNVDAEQLREKLQQHGAYLPDATNIK